EPLDGGRDERLVPSDRRYPWPGGTAPRRLRSTERGGPRQRRRAARRAALPGPLGTLRRRLLEPRSGPVDRPLAGRRRLLPDAGNISSPELPDGRPGALDDRAREGREGRQAAARDPPRAEQAPGAATLRTARPPAGAHPVRA